MLFLTPPENAGQIVEVAYACTPEGLVRRTHDKSDRSTTYAIAAIEGDDWDWYESYLPVNGEPPVALDWQPLSEAELERLESE